MKTLFCILITLNSFAQQYSFKPQQHKVSLAFTALQGLADGFRDASMFGRVKGRWYNGSFDSWKLKYKNEDYTQGAAYLGSTSLFVMFSDAPHFSNMITNISGEMAKVYMPNMQGSTFWQKLKTVVVYSAVRSAAHNLVYGGIFKRK